MPSNNALCEPLEPRQFLSGTLSPFDVAADVRSIPFGGKTKAVFLDTNGSKVSIALKGPGTGAVFFGTDANADPSRIAIDGTTTKSSLIISGDSSTTQILVNGSLKELSAKSMDLQGDLTITGTASKIRVRGLSDSTVSVAAGGSLSFQAVDVFDTIINGGSTIKSLKFNTWFDNGGANDIITADVIGSISVKGDFEAEVAATSVASVKAGGSLLGDIRTTGSIGSVSAAAIGDISIYAGVTPGLTTLPTSTADFANADARIKSITAKGKFVGSFGLGAYVAAPSIVKVSFGTTATDAGGTPFGFAADSISSISGTVDAFGKLKLKKLTDPASSYVQGDFTVRLV